MAAFLAVSSTSSKRKYEECPETIHLPCGASADRSSARVIFFSRKAWSGPANSSPSEVVAIEMEATAKDLALCIHPHPTLTETIREAAESAARPGVAPVRGEAEGAVRSVLQVISTRHAVPT